MLHYGYDICRYRCVDYEYESPERQGWPFVVSDTLTQRVTRDSFIFTSVYIFNNFRRTNIIINYSYILTNINYAIIIQEIRYTNLTVAHRPDIDFKIFAASIKNVVIVKLKVVHLLFTRWCSNWPLRRRCTTAVGLLIRIYQSD